ncbi:MAG: thiolase family protein [Planctomycetes bacterium]|nr:thiolase family protein [Planctomycetota bacterium]
MREAVICEAVRTPVTRKKGEFAEVRTDQLVAICLNEIASRTGVDPLVVDDVVMGCVTAVNEQGMNVARNAVLTAGWPIEVPGTTVNRLCGSSLEAFCMACAKVRAGQEEVVIAAGGENMTRVPMGSDGGAFSEQIVDRFDIVPQGISAELIAQKWGLSRRALDEFSLRSHERAVKATEKGWFDREIVGVPYKTPEGETKVLRKDTGPRTNTSMEKLAALEPAFKKDGVVTAGNSSQISDGGSAVLITHPERARKLGLKPRARFVAEAVVGVDPTIMLTGPIPATRRALKRANLSVGDIDHVEINEAFAAVALACGRDLNFNWERTNPQGGAVALGHPLGCTGAKLVATTLHGLERTGGRFGLITLCIGFGIGIAAIIERITE